MKSAKNLCVLPELEKEGALPASAHGDRRLLRANARGSREN
jgi:hypothetical protein